MKKNKFILLATVLTFSFQVCAYVPMPPPPDYKNCPIIQTSVNSTNPDGSIKVETQSAVDPGCVKSENQKYSALQKANVMANNLGIDQNGGVLTPVEPTYATCHPPDASGNLDYACISSNASLQRAYNEKMAVYSKFKEDEKNATAQQQAAVTARKGGSASQQLATAETEALKGQKDQSKVSSIAMGASIGFAASFAATCMTLAGCYQPLAYASAAAALLSFMTAKQAAKDADMAFKACESYNQMASDGKNCGAPPPPFDPEHIATVPANTFPFGQVDKTTGQCLPSAPATCKTDLANLNEKGVKVRDVLTKGASGFAGPNAPFKLNKDGTVTLKDGKTYKPEDFASKEAMIAAGMSPADAGAVAKDLYGKDGVYAKAGLDPKADLAAMPKGLGSFDMGGAGGSSTVKGALDDKEKLGLGTKDDSANGANGSSRKPTNSDSEGLVKDFNGDSIGISKDDIFKMMNKRYILKSAQDSFIGQ